MVKEPNREIESSKNSIRSNSPFNCKTWEEFLFILNHKCFVIVNETVRYDYSLQVSQYVKSTTPTVYMNGGRIIGCMTDKSLPQKHVLNLRRGSFYRLCYGFKINQLHLKINGWSEEEDETLIGSFEFQLRGLSSCKCGCRFTVYETWCLRN